MVDRFVRLFRRLDPCVGIDFSSDTIRLCSVRDGGKGEAFNLHTIHYHRDGADPHVIGRAIRAALNDVASHCVIGIPSTETFVKTAVPPGNVSLEDSFDVRRWAVAQVPMDEADIEVSIDVHPCGFATRSVASIAAVKRTALTWYLKIADAAALEVESVTIRPHGLGKRIGSLSGFSPQQNHVVIDSDEACTMAHMFRGTMWLGSFATEINESPSEIDCAYILAWFDTYGIHREGPVLVSHIGATSRKVSLSQSKEYGGTVEFNPHSFGPEVYAVGLMASERGVA